MTGEEFSLKWNDHSKVFFAGAEKLAEEQEYTDVTLAAGDKTFPAHKMVLSVCSPYFQRLFRQLGTEKMVIYLKDILPRHLDLLLQYMYKGEIKVEEKELVTILNIAQSLEIKGLTDTVSGPKGKDKETSSLKLTPPKDIPFTSPVKDPTKPKRGPVPQPYNSQYLDNGGSEKKRSKMEMVNEAQQILDGQTSTRAITDTTLTEVKQEFGAVTIERGAKAITSFDNPPNNAFQKPENVDTSVANMGYDGFEDDNDASEYLPQDGIVLQDDDRGPVLDCPVCGKQFATKHNLGQHWRVHSGERPFTCPVCGKGFKQKAHMQKHLSSHRQRGEVVGSQMVWMGNMIEDAEDAGMVVEDCLQTE